MSVKFEKNNEKLIIKLIGRLDTPTSLSINDEVEEKLKDNSITEVIFDMSELVYLSSSGIRILVTVAKEMHIRNGSIGAINYSPSIKKVLDITEFFSICKK